MHNFVRFLTGASAVTAATLCLNACGSKEPQGLAQHAMPAMPVKLATIVSQPVDQSWSFMATMKSRKSAVLQPRVSGTISRIYVQAGALVAANTPLIQIDPERQQATVASAAAATESTASDRENAEHTLQSLQANKISKQANVKFMQQELQRYGYLSQQGAVPKETYENYATQLKVAEADLQSIEAQIAAQKSAIGKMDKMIRQNAETRHEKQVELQYYTIKAPFDGMVGDIPFRLGEYVDSQTKLTTVTQNQPLEVYVNVPAEKGSALKVGAPIVLTDSSGKRLGEASVFFISPVADESQSVLVKAIYPNTDGTLRSNQTVSAQLVWQRGSGITVPTYAVSHISGQDFVFVADGHGSSMMAKQKAVTLGDIVGNGYVVKSGLQAGEQVVVSGVQNLTDNTPIAQQE